MLISEIVFFYIHQIKEFITNNLRASPGCFKKRKRLDELTAF